MKCDDRSHVHVHVVLNRNTHQIYGQVYVNSQYSIVDYVESDDSSEDDTVERDRRKCVQTF